MKHTRLATLILTATITASLATASLTATGTAFASAPEFSPGTPQTFTGDGSTSKLETSSGTKVECLSSLSHWEITGPKTVGNLTVTFHNCHSPQSGGCSLKSEGGPNPIINTMDGELGSVKPTEAASGVGLLILPTAGTSFVTLEGSCLPLSPSPVSGEIAAEVTGSTAQHQKRANSSSKETEPQASKSSNQSTS
jgi:hypothetical protein